jgi:hypothetical protein
MTQDRGLPVPVGAEVLCFSEEAFGLAGIGGLWGSQQGADCFPIIKKSTCSLAENKFKNEYLCF